MNQNLIQNNYYKQESGRVIRDARFMTRPQEVTVNIPVGLKTDLEEDIAVAFDKKDLLQLTRLYIEIERNNVFIKKAKNSPLYVNSKQQKLDKEKDLIETAMYLIISDVSTNHNIILNAYNTLNNFSVFEKCRGPLRELFERKLGISESIKRKNMILDTLREAQNGLGFMR